ncbi:hypothetical protein ACFOY8_03315 [Thalassospira xianhensis]|uniref:Uncharacterized protein n=1 Tax=Thalassospira xianhensis MCCC 1A02616 TaxID=1177929 RepID=A0A367UEW4_9PROT|nr:hypothetical protein [Thalassospira xianhensis]RCK06530.1 hypothetical protein TH5_08555 [Thalassospira xianhensis MCCC 1A02616]
MNQPLSQAAKAAGHPDRNRPPSDLLRSVAFCLIACALVLFGGGTSITTTPVFDGTTFPHPFNTVNHDSGPAQALLPATPDRAIAGNRQTPNDIPAHQPTFPDNAAIVPSVTSHAATQSAKRLFEAGTITVFGAEILPVSPRAPPFEA